VSSKPVPADRRLSPRRETRVKAMVAHHSVGLTKCKLVEIGIDGALIETGDLGLRKGADADLVLKIRRGNKITHCRVPAKVVRVIENGAALAFDNLDEGVYRILLEIVYPD
jgi:hypothetical protein